MGWGGGGQWLPAEYGSPEELEEDRLGVARQEVALDDVLEFALQQVGCSAVGVGRAHFF